VLATNAIRPLIEGLPARIGFHGARQRFERRTRWLRESGPVNRGAAASFRRRYWSGLYLRL